MPLQLILALGLLITLLISHVNMIMPFLPIISFICVSGLTFMMFRMVSRRFAVRQYGSRGDYVFGTCLPVRVYAPSIAV
jgi:hypothetical protein